MVQLILFIAPLYNFTVQKNDCYMFLYGAQNETYIED